MPLGEVEVLLVPPNPDASSHNIYGIMTNVTSTEVIRLLKRDGWVGVRVRGSHHHFAHATKPGVVTVPHPKKDIPIGTLVSIGRQAGIKLR